MWKQSVHELFWLLTSFFPHFQVVFPKVVNLKQLSRRCCFIKHATCEYKIASKSIPFLLKGYPSIIDITDSYSCMCIYIYIYHIILYHIISYYIILYHYHIISLYYHIFIVSIYVTYCSIYHICIRLLRVAYTMKCIEMYSFAPNPTPTAIHQPYLSKLPNCCASFGRSQRETPERTSPDTMYRVRVWYRGLVIHRSTSHGLV